MKTGDERYAKEGLDKPAASLGVLQGLRRFMNNYAILYAIIILCVLLAITTDNFLRVTNLVNVLRQNSMVVMLAIGEFFVLVAGSLDISTGAIVALISILFSKMMVDLSLPPLVAAVLAIFFGMLIGLFNGLVITRLKIPAMIATLAMQYVCNGAVYLISGGYAVSGLPDSISFLGKGDFMGWSWLPWPVLIMLLIAAAAHFISQKTTFGRSLYAIGGNVEAAYLSGIRDKRILTMAHVICGGLAASASIVLTSRLASGQVNAGSGWEFEAIIGAIIGGVSITGGRGRVFGAVFGTFLVGILVNGMTLNDIDSNVQKIVKGLVLIFAIAFDIYAVNKKNKR